MNKGFVLTTLMLICGAMTPMSAAVEVADSTSVDASATFSIIEHISTTSTAKIHQSDKLTERLKRDGSAAADGSASSASGSSGSAAVCIATTAKMHKASRVRALPPSQLNFLSGHLTSPIRLLTGA
jgi:hypothetical protein